MPSVMKYLLSLSLCCYLRQTTVEAKLNYTECAVKATSTHQRFPNSSFLVNAKGKPISSLSQAQGVSYEWCAENCGSSDNYNDYNWNYFSQGLLSWLVPWLALTAQLPFGTRSKALNLWALCLAVGSPSLSAYSLALTLLNSRSINETFQKLKAANKHQHGSHKMKMIKAARTFLIESQSVPIQIYNGVRREFAQLVVLPENIVWWSNLRKEILKSKKEPTFSLYAQIGSVCISQIIAIINYLVSGAISTDVGIGLAINSLWIWELPVVLGWAYTGTQEHAESITAALASIPPPRLRCSQVLDGECIGIRDRASFNPFRSCLPISLQSHNACSVQAVLGRGNFQLPLLQRMEVQESPVQHQTQEKEQTPHSVTSEKPSTAPPGTTTSHSDKPDMPDAVNHSDGYSPSETESASSEPHGSSVETFCGFAIAGYDCEPGPIFYFARAWSHMNAVDHVAGAINTINVRQGVWNVRGQAWVTDSNRMNENLEGSPEECSRYISPLGRDEQDLSIHANGSTELHRNCVYAAVIAVLLQWGTTGAAFVIAYGTPVVGLGCQSLSYLMYGLLSTVAWLMLLISAYLSHRWSTHNENSRLRPNYILGPLAVMTRKIGELLAFINFLYVIVISGIQMTNILDNCWCDACVPGLGKVAGWVILFASDEEIAATAKPAWIGGVTLGILCAAVITAGLFISRGDEIYSRNKR